MGQYYLLICSENAVEQLMDLATRHCRDAVFEISRQLERQKGRPNKLCSCYYFTESTRIQVIPRGDRGGSLLTNINQSMR